MKHAKGMLTLTIITHRATSLNYGENIGNVSILKKLSIGDNSQITYVSDKALKYDIRRKGKEEKGWKLLDEKVQELVKGSLKDRRLDVNEFAKQLLNEYEEFDLFGGLLTKLKGSDSGERNDKEQEGQGLLTNLKGSDNKKVELSYGDSIKRIAPVKITYAFSISKFQGDMDFMNNIDAYNRYIKHIEQKEAQVITQSEQHTDHYYYTLAVDLDRIGVWEGEKERIDTISSEEKAKRVKDLLDIIKTLSRQIRGRCENLSPIFVIGGIYKIKNPFFMGSISAKKTDDGKLLLDVDRLLDCKGIIPEEEKENTQCGLVSGFFANEGEISKKLNCKKVGEVFKELKQKVEEIYGVSKS